MIPYGHQPYLEESLLDLVELTTWLILDSAQVAYIPDTFGNAALKGLIVTAGVGGSSSSSKSSPCKYIRLWVFCSSVSFKFIFDLIMTELSYSPGKIASIASAFFRATESFSGRPSSFLNGRLHAFISFKCSQSLNNTERKLFEGFLGQRL